MIYLNVCCNFDGVVAMDNHGQKNTLKMMTREDIDACGLSVPSFKQLSANMEKRLKKVRGEETDNESFLLRHNYKNNSNCCQA